VAALEAGSVDFDAGRDLLPGTDKDLDQQKHTLPTEAEQLPKNAPDI
jgi:hypothetical protein